MPTAVFCAGDLYAIGAMRCVKDNGLSIPDDISFIGIDDIIVSTYVDPPLTTVSLDELEMGKITMRMMYDILNDSLETPVYILNGRIVERSSVKRT
jgi:LacI family transcriptional regulator